MATGEQRINEILTKVGLEGGPAAIRAAQAYDAAVKDISISSQAVDKATLGLDGALKSLTRQYDAAGLAGTKYATDLDKIQRLEDQGKVSAEQAATLRAGASDKLAASLQRAGAAAQATGPALNNMSQGAAAGAKNFGLASHQIQNLSFQANDLITQIASGGGIFRPLIQQGGQVYQILQQGEGGVGGVLRNIGASLARIGPLGIAAFGAAGLAGAVGLSSIALAKHGAELQRNEAQLRAFSTRSGEIIAVAQKVSTTLGVSATGGFRALADETIRWGNALGIVNVEQWITNFGRLALSQNATTESADAAAAAFAKLAAQGNVTAAQLNKFLTDFPQFGDAVAAALGVTRDQLKRIDQDTSISTKRLATAINNLGAAADANVRPWNQLSAQVGVFIDILGKLTSTSLDQFLDTTAREVYALAGAFENLVSWVDKYIQKLLQAAGIQLPQAPSAPSGGGGGGTAPDTGSRTTWQDMVDAMNKNADASKRTADNTSDLDSLESASRRTADNTDSIDDSDQDTSGSSARTAKYTEQTVSAVNALGGRLGGGGGGEFAGRFDPAAAAANTSALGPAKSITGGMSLEEAERTMPWGPAVGRLVRYGNVAGMGAGMDMGRVNREGAATAALAAGKNFYEAAQYAEQWGAVYDKAMREGKKNDEAVEAANEAMKGLAESASAAADSLDIGQLGQPIQDKIDKLRSQQDTALSRVYRPDPYAERNPDFFYSGERIFKEGQDKVYDGLQTQITKLEGLQTTLAQLVNQGNAFPSAIVAAMQAAGFGDIAAQIVAAFKTSAPASATPAPTAVQTPQFFPSGGGSASTPTPTATTGVSFNSMAGWSSVNR